MLDCGILRGLVLSLLDIRTPTMEVARSIERAQVGLANYLENHLFHGPQRNKIVLHYQLPRLNTLVPVVVVHNCFG
jgi:hypothetical protein